MVLKVEWTNPWRTGLLMATNHGRYLLRPVPEGCHLLLSAVLLAFSNKLVRTTGRIMLLQSSLGLLDQPLCKQNSWTDGSLVFFRMALLIFFMPFVLKQNMERAIVVFMSTCRLHQTAIVGNRMNPWFFMIKLLPHIADGLSFGLPISYKLCTPGI